MRIKQITWQYRRDFEAVYVCPFCGYEVKTDGYDDRYFHEEVIPAAKCPKCGKCENDDPSMNYRPLTTKYADDVQI
jgi:endogenous inhibitor of DNA gyrase (YacG/DUF329 family)